MTTSCVAWTLNGAIASPIAVSRLVTRDLGGDPARVRGVAVRFTGMVPMPSMLTVRGYQANAGEIHFDAVDTAGRPVLDRGVVKR